MSGIVHREGDACRKWNKRPGLTVKLKLLCVRFTLFFLNVFLRAGERLFFRRVSDPQNILIYKLGNIGDTICAIPALRSIRAHYPEATITLLTSPGAKGAIGAKEVLHGADYIDHMIVYYSDEMNGWQKKRELIKMLRAHRYDLFIQLPDDWATGGVLFRNILFAKVLGARGAMGFRLRTLRTFFKKAQIDYQYDTPEAVSLLEMLSSYGISSRGVEFGIMLSEAASKHVRHALQEQWSVHPKILIGICPGGKTEDKRWPVERFAEVATILKKKYNAHFIVFGGGAHDRASATQITDAVGRDRVYSAIDASIEEGFALLKECALLLTNDTGTMHMASAVEVPVVALFTIRSTYGRWFPYGESTIPLYHRFFNCRYNDARCIKSSILAISVREAEIACTSLLEQAL